MERVLIEFAVRASLIGAATAAVLWIARVKPAAARHAAWTGVMVVMLLLPLWTAWGPKAPVPILPREKEPILDTLPIAPVDAPATRDALPSRTPEPASPVRWPGIFLSIYAAGASLLLLRLAVGTLRVRRLVRHAFDRDGLLTSSLCAAPIAIGLFRPVVILPEDWPQWPQEKLDAVLTHEREHVLRRDPLVQWLAVFNRAVFWFHPLAW